MAFTPYHNDYINEFIENEDQETIVNQISDFSMPKLSEFWEDMKTDVAIDPSIKRTKEYNVASKSVLRRLRELQKDGIGINGRKKGVPSFWEVVYALWEGATLARAHTFFKNNKDVDLNKLFK
jgi:hypothetical protein